MLIDVVDAAENLSGVEFEVEITEEDDEDNSEESEAGETGGTGASRLIYRAISHSHFLASTYADKCSFTCATARDIRQYGPEAVLRSRYDGKGAAPGARFRRRRR